MKSWQDDLVNEMTVTLHVDPDVVALALFGSQTQSFRDDFSDVDLLIVVRENTIDRFHPSVEWLRPFGEVYACDRSAGEWTRVARVCFRDLRRLDLAVTTEAALARVSDPRVNPWALPLTLEG